MQEENELIDELKEQQIDENMDRLLQSVESDRKRSETRKEWLTMQRDLLDMYKKQLDATEGLIQVLRNTGKMMERFTDERRFHRGLARIELQELSRGVLETNEEFQRRKAKLEKMAKPEEIDLTD